MLQVLLLLLLLHASIPLLLLTLSADNKHQYVNSTGL